MAEAGSTALHILVGDKESVSAVLSSMAALKPKDSAWAVVSNEPGCVPNELLQAVQWRELLGGCVCCLAASSPLLRTNMAQLLRSKPRPSQLFLVLSSSAEPAQLLPMLDQYFGKAAPLKSIIVCTTPTYHLRSMAAAEAGDFSGLDHISRDLLPHCVCLFVFSGALLIISCAPVFPYFRHSVSPAV